MTRFVFFLYQGLMNFIASLTWTLNLHEVLRELSKCQDPHRILFNYILSFTQ